MALTFKEPRERIGAYEIIADVNHKQRNSFPVFLMAAVDAANPMRYAIKTKNSSVQFAVYREAMDYCKQRGWAK